MQFNNQMAQMQAMQSMNSAAPLNAVLGFSGPQQSSMAPMMPQMVPNPQEYLSLLMQNYPAQISGISQNNTTSMPVMGGMGSGPSKNASSSKSSDPNRFFQNQANASSSDGKNIHPVNPAPETGAGQTDLLDDNDEDMNKTPFGESAGEDENTNNENHETKVPDGIASASGASSADQTAKTTFISHCEYCGQLLPQYQNPARRASTASSISSSVSDDKERRLSTGSTGFGNTNNTQFPNNYNWLAGVAATGGLGGRGIFAGNNGVGDESDEEEDSEDEPMGSQEIDELDAGRLKSTKSMLSSQGVWNIGQTKNRCTRYLKDYVGVFAVDGDFVSEYIDASPALMEHVRGGPNGYRYSQTKYDYNNRVSGSKLWIKFVDAFKKHADDVLKQLNAHPNLNGKVGVIERQCQGNIGEVATEAERESWLVFILSIILHSWILFLFVFASV